MNHFASSARLSAARGLSHAMILGFLLIVSVAPAAVAQPSGADAVVGYWDETHALVADANGQTIRTYPNFDKLSLNQNVLAGERSGRRRGEARIVAFDAVTGTRLYGIPDARLPVVTAEGRRIAFFPTTDRDEYAQSVWIRTANGRVRRIVRFSAGPGHPGIHHGMRGGAVPLDIALDQRGRTMAVVAGLETLRSFDVWVVDVRTKEAIRMTRGENSHNPSLSPDGSRLAVRVESPEACPDDFYGEILIGKIRVFALPTGEQKTVTRFDCEMFYDTPRWIDNDSIVAVRVTKDESEEFGYDLDIVKIEVDTATITEVLTEGNPCCLSVSPALGKIAYAFSDRPGFAILDLATGTVVDFSGPAFVPHLSGENRL